MTWWQRLKNNLLARLGAVLLLTFYLAVLGAEFIAPYDPYESQLDGALLPPTQIYWSNQQGQFQGPHVYPTTQGPVDLETGQRELKIDRAKPSPIGFFVAGDPYRLFRVVLPLPTRFSLTQPKFEEREIFSGIFICWVREAKRGTTSLVQMNKLATN
jgi:peptide/nickel transport system permease protein